MPDPQDKQEPIVLGETSHEVYYIKQIVDGKFSDIERDISLEIERMRGLVIGMQVTKPGEEFSVKYNSWEGIGRRLALKAMDLSNITDSTRNGLWPKDFVLSKDMKTQIGALVSEANSMVREGTPEWMMEKQKESGGILMEEKENSKGFFSKIFR